MSPDTLTSPPPDDERTLLLLGLLTAQDRHGYEINDFIERTLHHVIHLKKATAYQLLERLEGHGLVESRVEQHGQRPNRRVYRLTEAGRARFGEMLRSQLAREEALILTGNVPVMFAENLTPQETLDALRRRLAGVEARLRLYESYNLPCTVGVGLAMERIRLLTQADRDWLTRTIERLARSTPTGGGGGEG
ncbi:PadR family transcriptional regulator [Deinococcus aestuarii]|uniref:PadR family transcriptional regulator n=1 Tax=Deinococcus aestuarii TaxID=2774531 RepID=UPI001C0E7F49|nr:PadR family transcriptional regulator [Deinococcus aestuarii]